MKFFFHISEKEQKERIEDLLEDIDTKWRVNDNDNISSFSSRIPSFICNNNRHFFAVQPVMQLAQPVLLEDTNMPSAPWYIIDAKSRKWTELQILEILTQGIEIALNNHALSVPRTRYGQKLQCARLLEYGSRNAINSALLFHAVPDWLSDAPHTLSGQALLSAKKTGAIVKNGTHSRNATDNDGQREHSSFRFCSGERKG